MNISSKNGLFEARITGGLLTAHRSPEPLFTCRLTPQPWFVIHSDGLYAQNAHDALTPLYRGDDAAALLICLTEALHSRENRLAGRKKLTTGIAALTLAVAAWLCMSPPAVTLDADSARPAGLTAAADTSNMPMQPPYVAESRESGRPVAHPVPAQPAVFAPMPSVPGTAPAEPAGAESDLRRDGWSLPAAARRTLPARLQNAASRGLFTVPLSSGHARTLYVFADPDCPNCQRMERHFETAAGLVNVVIFPVTIEGGDASLKALTPVMALDESARAAAWKRLFAADAGISVPGALPAPAVTDETLAETARGAIGVNEVAFRAYRLPGTPWTISDDGRYVPQTVLSSPAALTAFLNGDNHVGQ